MASESKSSKLKFYKKDLMEYIIDYYWKIPVPQNTWNPYIVSRVSYNYCRLLVDNANIAICIDCFSSLVKNGSFSRI